HREKKWDALDLPDDEPAAKEKVFAYRLAAKPGAMHLNTGRNPGGGFYPIAQYVFVEPQPSMAELWDKRAWQEWCQAQPPVDLECKAPQASPEPSPAAKPEPPAACYAVERRMENGVEAVKHLPYAPPVFPVRDCIIVERATGAPVLVTPGGMVEVSPPVMEGRRIVKQAVTAPRPYKLLRNPADRMHATMMTVE